MTWSGASVNDRIVGELAHTYGHHLSMELVAAIRCSCMQRCVKVTRTVHGKSGGRGAMVCSCCGLSVRARRRTRTGRCAGLLYFHHDATASAPAQSLWYDPELPPGWAWESGRPDRDQVFVRLCMDEHAYMQQHAQERRTTRPSSDDVTTMELVSVEGSTEGGSRKRPRMEAAASTTHAAAVPDAAALDTQPSNTAAAAVDVSNDPPAAPTRPEPRDPGPRGPACVCACVLGRGVDGDVPDEPPMLAALCTKLCGAACTGRCKRVSDTGGCARTAAPMASPFFGPAHKSVLRQVLASAYEFSKQRVKALKASGTYDEWMTPSVCCVDVGAGVCAVTQYFLQVLPEAAAVVYAIDACNTEEYVGALTQCGRTDLAAAVREQTRDVDMWTRLLLNVWRDADVTPMRFPARAGLARMKRLELDPQVIYLDAELHYEDVKATIDYCLEAFPTAHIVGGGWDESLGVRKAVTEVATSSQRPLHVEQDTCWTLSGHLITMTANTGTVVSAADIAAAEKLQVKSERVESDTKRKAWFNAAANILTEHDDVKALRVAIGSHGRGSDECWIDDGGDDKRHLTLLMHAASNRRLQCTRALIEEFGASVNHQADRSGFTALGLAAYNGALDIVKLLLRHGADPRLANKWGENAIKNAEQRKHADIVKLLQAHAASLQ